MEAEEFSRIVVKTGKTKDVVYLRDIARVELGARNQDQTCTLDGKPSVGLAVFQLPGSNAVTTADHVQAKMAELNRRFPVGLDYSIVYDTTPFVRESIHEVQKTLFEAIGLVTLVVLLFLQNWRSVIIPLVAVPVSLVGTFAVMALLGFSLNNISLLGLVLAIGVVVDDAIVVVENVERWIEHGLSPREAAYKSMEEVTVAVIAIAFGLSAVFIPTAFISGISGQFYRQFALTIAASTLISAFNSLTLSPALAAILLKPHGGKKDWLTAILDATFGWLFRGFNRAFNATTTVYARLVRLCIRGTVVALLVYGGLLWLTYVGFRTVPTGFVPDQDKGYLIVSAQLPDSASLERTKAVLKEMETIALSDDMKAHGVGHTLGIAGQSFLLNANGSNFASLFVVLKPFHDRHGAENRRTPSRRCFAGSSWKRSYDAQVAVFGAPPVDGLGNAGGFKLMVKDTSNEGLHDPAETGRRPGGGRQPAARPGGRLQHVPGQHAAALRGCRPARSASDWASP